MKHWLWAQISTNGSPDLAKMQAIIGIPCLIVLIEAAKWLRKVLLERRKRKQDRRYVENYSRVISAD